MFTVKVGARRSVGFRNEKRKRRTKIPSGVFLEIPQDILFRPFENYSIMSWLTVPEIFICFAGGVRDPPGYIRKVGAALDYVQHPKRLLSRA